MTPLASRPLTSMRHRPIQRTEVQLKPETVKCYSRQIERAIEIIFASHAPCVLRRKRVLGDRALSGGCGFAACRRRTEWFIASLFFRVRMLATSTLTKVQQAADSPRNLTGAFRSHG